MPIELTNINSGYNLDAINDNFQTIENTWDEKVDRFSSVGNHMDVALDMNSYNINNLAIAENGNQAVPLKQVRDLIDGAPTESSFIKYIPPSVAEGQTEFTIPHEFLSATVLIDGRVQSELSGAYQVFPTQQLIILSEPLSSTQTVEFWLDQVSNAIYPGDRPGSRGNPYVFDILEDLKNADFLVLGDWAETLGRFTKLDGENAQYYVVASSMAEQPDGEFIIALPNDKKGVLMYKAPTQATGDQPITEQPGFPYEWSFPANNQDRVEMQNNVASNSIGFGGSTWWINAPQGRKEDGRDVVYRCDTYGTAEDRELEQGELDSQFWTNKRLGEAVIKVTRVEVPTTGDTTYTAVGTNDRRVSYREDEHHQPSVWFGQANGQMITSFGSRNTGRFQDGTDATTTNIVRYGINSDNLSSSETITYPSTADYAQGFFAGNTSFLFQRENVGNWYFSRGSGGQNYGAPTQFFDQGADDLSEQFYFNIAYVDKSLSGDPQAVGNRSKVHFFGQPHPTANPDNNLYYCVGTFIPAGQELPPFSGGGVYVTRLSDGQPVSGTNGLLNTTFQAITESDMDTIYTPAAGKTYRLLDVEYGDTPRALIAEFVFDWDHGDTVPFGKTYDLKLVQYNGASWVTTTIATGLRGMLGYKPLNSGLTGAGAPTGSLGQEGYTSAYVFGASFYRGSDFNDTQPIVYYCDRVGSDQSQHRMHKVTLDAGYATVVSDNVIEGPTDKILYRPEMTLYGDKRYLWYNEANDWSTFNSWTAYTKWKDET